MTQDQTGAFVYQLTGQEVIEALPDPASLAAPTLGQMAVETLITAISPGTELAAWTGAPPLRPTARVYPRLMGYCNVGRITGLGSDIDGFEVEELVLTHSAHRSHALITPNEVLCKVPAGADLAQVSTTYLFHLGYAACLKAGMIAGHQAAVIGLGTLGMTAAAMAHLSGARVTGFSNHVADGFDAPGWGLAATQAKTSPPAGESQYDAVISTTNAWADWKLALQLARPGGTIVTIGFPGRGQDAPDFNPLASQYLYDKQLTITACGHMPDLDVAPMDVRFTLKRNCAFLCQAIIDGRLPAADLIEGIRPAGDLAQIYADMTHKRTSGRTIILDWQGATI